MNSNGFIPVEGSTSATLQAHSVCPKCGKPKYAFGDFVDTSGLCQCGNEPQFQRIPAVTTNGTYIYPNFDFVRLLALLERIVVAVERLAATEQPELCAICGQANDFLVDPPYGSKHEGEKICGGCIDRLFERKEKI